MRTSTANYESGIGLVVGQLGEKQEKAQLKANERRSEEPLI